MADPAGTNSRAFAAYAAISQLVRGIGTSTSASPVTIISAQPGPLYVTSLQFANSSGTTVTCNLNDSVSSVFIVPAGGGSNVICPVPLVVAPNTALTFTLSTGVSSVTANAQGYVGTSA